MPLVLAACLMAAATRVRAGSTPAVAEAFELSTDIFGLRSPRNDPPTHLAPDAKAPTSAPASIQRAAIMVKDRLRRHYERQRSNPRNKKALDCFVTDARRNERNRGGIISYKQHSDRIA